MKKCLKASHKTKYTPSQQFYFTKLAKINKNEFTKLLAQDSHWTTEKVPCDTFDALFPSPLITRVFPLH